MADDAESPLAWLAKRKDRTGQPLIAPHQLLAGDKLRADFTCAHMMPRTTSNWDSQTARDRRHAMSSMTFSEAMLAARQRVNAALEAAGPEFSGLLMDVCCFLKGLEDVERERRWPARSAKVVLQLALDRLARHYGLTAQARGPSQSPLRSWLAPGEKFVVEV